MREVLGSVPSTGGKSLSCQEDARTFFPSHVIDMIYARKRATDKDSREG